MLKIDIIVIMIYYVDLESLKGVTYKRFQRQLHLWKTGSIFPSLVKLLNYNHNNK